MCEVDLLAAALVAFQADVPTIPKNRTAKMGSYSYRYADLTDMWDAIREPLHKNGLAVTQPLTAAAPNHMALKTTIWHSSGQTVSDVFEFPVAGKSPQEIGSLVTYMKRYALGAALGISTDDDDDGNAATHPKPTAVKREVPPADKARAELRVLAGRNGWDLQAVADAFGKDGGDLKTATADQVTAFTALLESGAVAL